MDSKIRFIASKMLSNLMSDEAHIEKIAESIENYKKALLIGNDNQLKEAISKLRFNCQIFILKDGDEFNLGESIKEADEFVSLMKERKSREKD
jgi:hypothetical protein